MKKKKKEKEIKKTYTNTYQKLTLFLQENTIKSPEKRIYI